MDERVEFEDNGSIIVVDPWNGYFFDGQESLSPCSSFSDFP